MVAWNILSVGGSLNLPPCELQVALAGRYQIERELGRGGMATVYLAHDHSHDRLVALKVLRPEVSGVATERFAREIAIAARLRHPHILPIHDSGELRLGANPPVLFYTMAYAAGRSLRERLHEEPQLPVDEAVGIARQVAGALDHAHRQGIVHRDIKPENILLAGGEALVADFGIARALDIAGGERLTETGLALGTPAYMSPEQGEGSDRLDGRADIYALGCVLYEMLAGQPPFTGPTAQAILARHAMDPVPSLRSVRSTVTPDLARLVTRALAKVPADRFGTAEEFAKALEARAEASVSDAPGTAPGRRTSRRRLGARAAVTAVAVIVAIGAGMLRRKEPPSPLDPGLVAVLPFRVAGADPRLAWLRDGLVDLLALQLTGEGGLRAAEPGRALSAWHRVAGPEGKEITQDAALVVARGLGAGRLIDGSVVGTPDHLTLTASLLTTLGGRNVARASVEGPADSISGLLDRLAARLLSVEVGADTSRLSSFTSTSVPAIRAYLAGRAAFRGGRLNDAFNRFREATLLDSTFALAALELLHTSVWTGGDGDDLRRARRLALAGKSRLGPADQALLDIHTGPFPTGIEWIKRWQSASARYPDRAEIWYGLGDAYYHNGLSVGFRHPFQFAGEAFQRGWAIDSAEAGDSGTFARSPVLAEPLRHMVEIAQMTGDTASVRRLTAIELAVNSTGESGWYFRWHRAIALGDSARRAFWADSIRVDPGAIGRISEFIEFTGVGIEDYLRTSLMDIRHAEATEPAAGAFQHGVVALNGGRPHEARTVLSEIDHTGPVPGPRPMGWRLGEGGAPGIVDMALYWQGDTGAAAEALQRLTPLARRSSRAGEPARAEIEARCVLATWRAARGDYRGTGTAIRYLRETRVTGLHGADSTTLAQYTALLDATRSTALRLQEAWSKLEQADQAARNYNTFMPALGANLVVARVAEVQGDLPLALRALRRRAGIYGSFPSWYLSTYLREEGRLAALTGDTAGAARAYQHYLALRPDPEPEVRPEVERVRGELAKLLQEPRS